MSERLCPKCGAYWRCDCVLEELSYVPLRTCEHDWVDAVGVEIDVELGGDGHSVRVCRICGVYAVHGRASSPSGAREP